MGLRAIAFGSPTGTGNYVKSASPTFTGTITAAALTLSGALTLSALTASTALALDGSKAVVSVTNTGSGNNVLSAGPTLTGTIGAASMTLSGTLVSTGLITANGGVTIGGGTDVAGKIYLSAEYGVTVRGKTGSAFDSAILANNGAYVFRNPVGTNTAEFVGILLSAPSEAAFAGFRVPHGTAPSSPVNGDIWTTTAGFFIRINGVTRTVTVI